MQPGNCFAGMNASVCIQAEPVEAILITQANYSGTHLHWFAQINEDQFPL